MKRPKSLDKQRSIIIAVLAVLVIGGSVAGLNALTNNKSTGGSAVVNSVSVTAPAGWIKQPVAANERQIGVLGKLTHTETDGTYVLRTVTSDLDDSFDIKELPADLEKSFKQEIENFSLVNKATGQSGDYKYAQIRYKEKQAQQKEIHESVMLVIPLEKQSFYLAFRAPQSQFSKIEADITRITDNFSDYLESHTSQKQ